MAARRWRQICLLVMVTAARAEYVWDGSEWLWQDTPVEGSGSNVYGGAAYGVDDDEEPEGSGEGDDFPYDNGGVGGEADLDKSNKDLINVDAEEIDPRDVDIGFDDPPPLPSSSPLTTTLPPGTTPAPKDPLKHANQDTNFFAQPGILAAVVGGTVVGLLCTILLVMLIVYRMRKADEGSYALNEPKRSPNVHSYLKAPTREFFA